MTNMKAKTEPIAVEYPAEEPISVRLKIGVGTLTVAPGGDLLVSGEITYNVAEWAPEIVQNGGKIIIKQGELWPNGWVMGECPRNEWDLKIGARKPLDFRASSGAARSKLALGGLPLNNFTFDGGVGQAQISFDGQNPQLADIVKVSGGVGSLDIDHLLNANARAVNIHGGGSSMRVDFTGETPSRDMTVHISIGVGRVVLNIKDGLPTQVYISQGLGGVRVDDNFTWSGNHTYETEDFGKASGPRLVINVTSGVGGVELNMVSRKQRVPVV